MAERLPRLVTAHQRVIREQEAARDPRAVIPLTGCRVERVERDWATRIILRYEWLKTMPTISRACYGLVGPTDEPLGAVVFGSGSGTHARLVCGEAWADRAVVLERGACVHYAHEHAASFLIAGAVRQIAVDLGIRVVLAYADQEAGEIGTVYQACNWLYLGNSNGRGGSGSRLAARRVDQDDWLSSRSVRRMARKAGYEDTSEWWAWARASGIWEIRRVVDRSRYITFAGPRNERRAARAALRYPVLPYPKRQPGVAS